VTDQVQPVATSGRPHRFRYLIDIVALIAATFLLDAVVEAFVNVPVNLRLGLVLDAIDKMLLVGVGWALLRLRGERLADIGLKRPKSWWQTVAIGVGLAAIIFVGMYFSEKAGFRRDLSKFRDVQENLELTIIAFCYALVGAGFWEEFTFRGFLMQGLAMCFGASRGAWIAACIIQGALFGAVHAYQNPIGIAIAGTLGVLMGVIVLVSGRNLWLVIIGHGLYDASRFVLFYFQGPPS
jgi:CAAX protease family protein